MSGHVLGWAWRQPVDDPLAKLLLVKLADQANDDGVCWPSRRTISADTGMSIRTISNKIGFLNDAGLLTVESRARENGGRTSNWYRITVGDPPGTTCPTPGHHVHPQNLELELRSSASELEQASSSEAAPSAQTLVGEYVDQIRANGVDPPRRVIGQLARFVGELVKEGQPPERIRAGLRRMSDRRLIVPSLLGNFVVEAGLPPPKRAGPGITADELWENGIDLEALNGNT